MGLLDDAIREHLDLKRRRGADPAEIERAEREALGPVRRKGGETASTGTETVSAAAEPELEAFIEADEAKYGDPLDDDQYGAPGDSVYDEPDEPVATDLAEADPIGEPDPPRLSFSREEDPFEDEDEGDDQEPLADEDPHATRVMRVPDEEPVPPPAPLQPTMSDATAEYDVEDALAAENDGDDEDVLEETPEFLQDTPDHDRLWFEQRPPRDFDFDG